MHLLATWQSFAFPLASKGLALSFLGAAFVPNHYIHLLTSAVIIIYYFTS